MSRTEDTEDLLQLEKQVMAALTKTLQKINKISSNKKSRNSSKLSWDSSVNSSDLSLKSNSLRRNYSQEKIRETSSNSQTLADGSDALGHNGRISKYYSDPGLVDHKASSSEPDVPLQCSTPKPQTFIQQTPTPQTFTPLVYSTPSPQIVTPCTLSSPKHSTPPLLYPRVTPSTPTSFTTPATPPPTPTSFTTPATPPPTPTTRFNLPPRPASAAHSSSAPSFSVPALGRSHSVTFLLNDSLEVLRPEKSVSADNILQDIHYLKHFREKHSVNKTSNLQRYLDPDEEPFYHESDNPEQDRENTISNNTGRYTMIDRDMQALDDTDHVITDLWRISGQKVNLALAGHMSSCQEPEQTIDCATINNNNNVASTSNNNVTSANSFTNNRKNYLPVLLGGGGAAGSDFHLGGGGGSDFHLGGGGGSDDDNSDSGNDTDDMIEDARNYVLIGQRGVVTLDDWEEIDFKRKERRKSRSLRMGAGKDMPDSQHLDQSSTVHKPHSSQVFEGSEADRIYLPRSLPDLQPGTLIKLLSPQGSTLLLGIVRYVGLVDGLERVGVELQDRRGDNDGALAANRYFTCGAGYGVFVPLNRILAAWGSSSTSSTAAWGSSSTSSTASWGTRSTRSIHPRHQNSHGPSILN